MILGFTTLASPAWSHQDIVLQIETLDTALQEQPANAELLAQRGDLYRRHEDYAAADRDFEAARGVNPEYALLDFYEGQLALDDGRPAEADFYLGRHLLTDPQNAKAWRLRGQVSILLGNPASAVKYFDQAIQSTRAPSPDLYRVLILSAVASGESNWPAAIAAVDTGLDRFGAEVTLLGLGSDIALASNQPSQAENYLNKLPPPLRTLPQWERRIETSDCLNAAEVQVAEQCLLEARESLQRQVNSFMNSE